MNIMSASNTTGTSNKQGIKVLLAGSLLQLFLGIIYVWSVFAAPVSAQLSWNIESVKLTSSFMLSFFVVGILVSGKLQTKVPTQYLALTGGLMLAAGTFATAFVPASAPWLIYMTYGVIGGFGVGAAYSAVLATAQQWFPKKRGFATGVSVCAFGFATVIFAPLVELLVGRFGLKSTFLILSGAFLAMVLATFRFIKLPQAAAAAAGKAAAALPEQKQYTLKQALATKEFYFITASLMLGTAAYFVLNPSFKTMAADRRLDGALATALVMVTGVANALGRLVLPLLSDKIGHTRAAFAALAATAVCALLLCFAQSFAFMAVVAVIAFCFGGYSGIYPVITAGYFGAKNMGANYGAVMVGFALSALLLPMGIGLLPSVMTKFIVLGTMAAFGAALAALLIAQQKKKA